MVQPVSFAAFLSLVDGSTVGVVPAQVASLARVNPSLLIPPTTDGTVIQYEDGTALAVVGTVAATLAALNGASVGSSLVLLPSADDPAVSFAIQGSRVSLLSAVPAALLPAGVLTATRITYEDGTERVVTGTVVAAAAALAVATPPAAPVSFANQFGFQNAGAGAFNTTNAALTAVPGSGITVPAGFAGNWLVMAIGYMTISNLATGPEASMRKNGAPIGQLFRLSPGELLVGDALPFVEHLFDNPAVGDVFDIAIASSNGADTAAINGARVVGWKTN